MFDLQQYSYNEFLNLGLLKYSPTKKRILDVGCGFGLLGEAFRENGNYVVGLDISPTLKISKKRLDEFYSVDITQYKRVDSILARKQFDAIVFADVLEHVYDPVSVLLYYKKYLKKGGSIFISVPNFTVWYNRFHILFGNYTYTDVGTRDKTHIRMFTAHNIKKLADTTGLRITHIDITPGIAQAFITQIRSFFTKSKTSEKSDILHSPMYAFYTTYLYPLEYLFCKLWPDLLAFQYIVILKK